MNNGWVKIHRKLLDNPIVCKDSDHLAVWIYLLLNATHETIPALFKGKRIDLQPGQLITGRISIGKRLSISDSKVRRILIEFENEHQIEQQTSNKNTLITVINWGEYQNREQQNEQQVNNNWTTTEQQLNNKWTTSEQQVNTNKNIKNMKNDKNEKNERMKESNARETQEQLLERLLPEKNFSERVQTAVREWMQYKRERRDTYSELALKKLLTMIENGIKRSGEDRMIYLIDKSISNRYQGIVFDNNKPKGNPNTNNADAEAARKQAYEMWRNL